MSSNNFFLPVESVQAEIRSQLDHIFAGSKPTTEALHKAAVKVVERLIYHHRRLAPFSRCDAADVSLDASGEDSEVTVRFRAETPQGALFLGELASVGFFGDEAQQALSPL